MIDFAVDEQKIQKDLTNLVKKGGMNKKYAKMAVRAAADVIDDASRRGYARQYTRGSRGKGSSDTHIKGNMLTSVDRKIYIARPRWRKWASKKGSIRFQSKKQQKTDFWFRSMMKRVADGRGNPSTLAHLIEDGAKHFRTGKKNFAHEIRRAAFKQNKRKALRVLDKGIVLAIKNATHATKIGLIDFRKRTQV